MGVRGQVRDAQIQEAFALAVGDAMVRLCRAERLERDTLVVASANPSLTHQLQLDSPRVMSAINKRLGATVVRRIRFIGLDPTAPR